MLSVVIPSRTDAYLQKTVDDLVEKASGEIEIIVILEQALQTRMRTPAEADKLLREARKLRELTAKYMITAAEMDRWKKEGRE